MPYNQSVDLILRLPVLNSSKKKKGARAAGVIPPALVLVLVTKQTLDAFFKKWRSLGGSSWESGALSDPSYALEDEDSKYTFFIGITQIFTDFPFFDPLYIVKKNGKTPKKSRGFTMPILEGKSAPLFFGVICLTRPLEGKFWKPQRFLKGLTI